MVPSALTCDRHQPPLDALRSSKMGIEWARKTTNSYVRNLHVRRLYFPARKVCNGKYFLHFHACRSEGGNLAKNSSYVCLMTIPVHEIRDPPKIHSEHNF